MQYQNLLMFQPVTLAYVFISHNDNFGKQFELNQSRV